MNKIIDIQIERANILLKLNHDIKDDVFLVCNNDGIKLDTNKDEIIINITNTPEGSMLDEGKYCLKIGNETLTLDEKIIPLLDDKSRVFKYRFGAYATLLTFEVDNKYNLYFNIDYMIKNTKYKKFLRLAEEDSVKKKIIKFFKIITLGLCNIFYNVVFFFHQNNKKILLLSESYDELSPNLRYFYESIKKDYKVKIYTCTKKNISSKLKELYYISTSRYIFMDNYVSLLSPLSISKKQVLVQFWHAGVGFKAVGYARFGRDGSPHPFVSAHRKYNYAVVDNDELINIYKEVFGCKKNVFIPCGMPRLDNYLNKDVVALKANKILKEVPTLNNKKIILFAPTYRGVDKEDATYDFSKIDLDIINDFCEENNFKFIIKMHPFIKEKFNLTNKHKNILDLSNYDINDLIYISDIMISDYSSCVYEYSFFDRPLILYRYDKTLYEYLRPIHTLDKFTKKQYEVYDFDELLKTLNKLKDINVKDRFSNVKYVDNDSCKKIINKILR